MSLYSEVQASLSLSSSLWSQIFKIICAQEHCNILISNLDTAELLF